ncbi:PIG-L family deacetylase [Paraburkholderia fungorum]|uniref:PIG-L deacetylase family protein n=1 Tax=Paraburkholderia fungorum TaxID=134537 RepID=UPI0038BB91BA
MRVGDNGTNLPAGPTAADSLEQQKPQAAAREPRHLAQDTCLPARKSGAARGASFGSADDGVSRKPGDGAPAHRSGGISASDTIVWPQLQPAPSRPAVLGFYPHRDDESNGSGGVRRLIRRGVQFDEAHATSGEGGKRIVSDRRTGTISQQDPEDPSTLARERGNESRRFMRMLGAGRRSTITSMRGNPDLDPFAPGARQDTAHLLDHEHGVWSALQTKQQLINLLAERRPAAVLTMTHDGAVHQAHRAMHELVEETVGEFAAHYGIEAPGVFGVRETGWATDDKLDPVDPERVVRVDLSRGEQRAKVRALVQSFTSQPPGHPFRSEDARLNPLHRFDVYLDSASTLAEQGTRSERNDNVHGWDFLRPEEYLIASDATGPAQIEALRALFGRKVSIRKVIRQALASRLPLPGPRRRTVELTPPRGNEEEN